MQTFPTLFTKSSVINKDQLNDNFINSILFNISKYHTKFITPYQYYGISIPTVYTITTELQNGSVQFDPVNNYYILTYNDQTITFGNVIEVYNISRNETYKVLHSENNVITFLQDYSTQEIISDIEHSSIRVLQNSSKDNIIQSELEFDIQTTYEPEYDSYLYIMLFKGARTFDLYQISLPEISFYIQGHNSSISDILTLMQDDQFDYTLYDGISYIGELVYIGVNSQTLQDITITVNDRNYLDYLDQSTTEKDIFYFYVNRNETLSIFIEDEVNTSSTVTVQEIEDILQFSNINYIFANKIKIEGQLPITISNLDNVTITGLGNQTSEINFSEQTFTGVTNFIDILDCTNLQFKDLTFQLYDPDQGELIPDQTQGYNNQLEYTLIKINQSSTNPLEILNDNIYIRHSILNRIEHIFEQGTNIVDSNYPKTDIESVQFIPRGIDTVQQVVDNLLEYGTIDPGIIPSYTLKIGDGSSTAILWEPLTNLNFTSSNDKLLLTFDDLSNTINFEISDVQYEDHTHDISDITTGILSIQRGGTNTNTFIADKYIYFNGTKFVSGLSEQDLIQQSLSAINIDVKDNSSTQFSLSYNDQITFQSQNGDLILTFDALTNKITFDANVPVTSVNGKIGDVTLTQQDIGQQQDTHNHDDLYLRLTGGTIRPTVDGDQLTIQNQQIEDIFIINTQNKSMTMYDGATKTLDIYPSAFEYKGFKITQFDQNTIVMSEQV